MFISRKVYDELNVRNVELARQVRDLSEENNQLRDLRRQEVHNNTTSVNRNRALTKAIKEMDKLSKMQQYNSVKNLQNKMQSIIKEVIQSGNENNF